MRVGIYNLATGQLQRVVTCAPYDVGQQRRAGEGAIDMPSDADDSTHYVADGVLTPFPPCPDDACVFDFAAGAWYDPRTLQDFRDAQWAAVKAARDAAEQGGFPYLGRVIDSDAVSVQRISIAVEAARAAAAAGQPFEEVWTCADNSLLALDAAAMIAMPVALATFGKSIHARARDLRAEIQAATTPAAVQSITW